MPDDQTGDAAPARLEDDICRSTAPNISIKRADGTDSTMPTMEGHFSTFGDWYEINSYLEGHFLERVSPGAFKRTFNAARASKDKQRIAVLLEHGHDPVVGDKPLGIAEELSEDAEGARYSVPLFDTSYNRDLVPALEAGAYGSSFRFQVLADEWAEPGSSEHSGRSDIPERTITEVRVSEFGPTVFPANPHSTAALRSTTDEYYERLREKNPSKYDAVLERAQKIRGSALSHSVPAEPVNDEDSRTQHSEDSRSDTHSEDSHETHSERTEEPIVHLENERNMELERMTVSERAERVKEIKSRLGEIDTDFNGGELSDEARTEWDSLIEERTTHLAVIADVQRRKDALEALEADEDVSERAKPVRTPKRAPAVKRNRIENIYDVEEYRREARSLDELPELYRDGAKRAIAEARVPGADVDPDAARAKAERLLETVDDKHGTLARRILVTGSPVYRRAFGKAVSSLTTGGLHGDEQRALSLGADGAGGFAVPFDLDPSISLTSDGYIDPLRRLARVETIVGKEWQGVNSAGITVTRAAEAAEAGDNAPTLTQPVVRAERVQGFVPFSVEADMAWSALQSEMTRLLADAKADEEANSFLNGNGVSPNPQGLLAAGAGITRIDTASVNAFAADDIYALKNAVGPRFRARGVYLAEASTYDAVRQLDTAGGADLWVQLQDDRPARLIGYAAEEASNMPVFSTASNTELMVFGDFRNFLIVDRLGMSVELVPHLFGAAGRPTGQRGIYAHWHNSCKVLVPGAFRVLSVGGV